MPNDANALLFVDASEARSANIAGCDTGDCSLGEWLHMLLSMNDKETVESLSADEEKSREDLEGLRGGGSGQSSVPSCIG